MSNQQLSRTRAGGQARGFAGVGGLISSNFGGGFGGGLGGLRGGAFLVPVVDDGHFHERPESLIVGKVVTWDDDGPGRFRENVTIIAIGDDAADIVPALEASVRAFG